MDSAIVLRLERDSDSVIFRLRSVGPAWQYAVTSDGKIIAILQNTTLETRSSKDNFASILGKTNGRAYF